MLLHREFQRDLIYRRSEAREFERHDKLVEKLQILAGIRNENDELFDFALEHCHTGHHALINDENNRARCR